ncbi:MAG: hypothetical protein GY742_02880 [Hyphomicrobiales bacterium]|nr:hypothetical protein [Hyphomicrobiales bacterium]
MAVVFDRLVKRQYYRNSEISSNYFSQFCHALAVLAISTFVLNTGSIESTALAKTKYSSGKSNISRSHHSSRRHKTRRHYNGHHRSSRKSGHHRRYTKRHGTHYRYGKHGSYQNYRYRPVRYRGPSVINVRGALLNKRAGNTRLSHRYRGHGKYYRSHHGNNRRIVVTGAMASQNNDIIRHILPEDPRGMTAIYYNTKLCEQDYDCVMRVGTRRSSSKIIVVGSKRDKANYVESNGVKIIYPPR